MTRLRADLLLLLSSFVWGTAFVGQKIANQSMGPVTFVGLKFVLAALVLVPFALMEAKGAKNGAKPLDRKDYLLAGVIGLCLFAGSSIQQIALLTTTATDGGFLTALYVVMVPFVVWLFTRQRPRFLVVAACAVSLAGAWLLADHGENAHWTFGDTLLLISDVAWALMIALVALFLERTHRPFFLSLVQFAVTAALGLTGFLFEPATAHGLALAFPSLLYVGLLSGGVGFTLQMIAQKQTPAAEAALIMSLESVFAAIAGAILLKERLTPLATLGCFLILFGVVMIEVGPLVLGKLKLPWPSSSFATDGSKAPIKKPRFG